MGRRLLAPMIAACVACVACGACGACSDSAPARGSEQPQAEPEPAAEPDRNPEPEPAPPTGDPLATAEPDDGAKDGGTATGPPPPMPECDVRCCSDEMLRAQKRAARRMGDPSVAQECCFCEEGDVE